MNQLPITHLINPCIYVIHTSNNFDFAVSSYLNFNDMKNHLKKYYKLKNTPRDYNNFCKYLIEKDICRFITDDYHELTIKLREYVEYYLSK